MGRPAAVGEDTALRALRDWLRRVRSRGSDEERQYGNLRNTVAATVKRGAASVPVGRRHAGLEVGKARSALGGSALVEPAQPVRRFRTKPRIGVGASRPLKAIVENSSVKGAAKKGGDAPSGLQQSALGKRQDVAAGDDQMIEHPNVDQFERSLQRPRQELIRPRRLGDARRMVVDEDQRGRIARQ